MTILLVEQMAKMALKICDYGYVMTNGRIVLEGNSKELLSNPELQASYLGGKAGAEKPPEEKVEPLREVAAARTDLAEPSEKLDRRMTEKERQEREKRKRELRAASQEIRQPPTEELPKPDQEIFKEQERLRQMRQQTFDSDRAFSYLKDELGQIRTEISGLKEVRRAPEDQTAPTPLSGKDDWRGFEKERQEEQAAWKPESVTEFGVGRQASSDGVTRESARKERQASFIREASEPLSPIKSNYKEKERHLQKHQKEWDSESRLAQDQEPAKIFERRPPVDRGQFEMARRERARTQQKRDILQSAPEKNGKKEIDRKSREIARQQRQAAMQQREQEREPGS
jgi:hypothetical protein